MWISNLNPVPPGIVLLYWVFVFSLLAFSVKEAQLGNSFDRFHPSQCFSFGLAQSYFAIFLLRTNIARRSRCIDVYKNVEYIRSVIFRPFRFDCFSGPAGL